MTPGLARVFDQAEKIAQKAGDSFVTVERLLLALSMDRESEAGKILQKAGVTPQNLNAAIETLRKGRTADSATAENAYDALKKYARDLTQAAQGRQDRSGHRPRRGNPPHHPGAVAADQEQSRADRRAGRRQDRDRRRARPAHRQRRRAGEPEGQEADGARHGRADRRREISRRVRGAAEGRAEGSHRLQRRHHPVHRRDAHPGRRRQGGRGDGRLQPAEARARARRIALRRRDHARRIQEACREGRRAGAALPAGLRLGADGRGHDLDPARPQGQVRAASRRAHHRRRDRVGGDPVEPLHHRPLPARQGDRPDRRGGGAAEDAGRFQAGRARFHRPRNRAAEDRAGGAQEGERRRLQGSPQAARRRIEVAGKEIRRPHQPLEVGKGKAVGRAEGQDRARSPAGRACECAAPRRIPAGGRARLWPHPRAREEAEGHRIRGRQGRDGGGGGHRRSHRAGGLALDRRAGRPDAGRREGKAPQDGGDDRQARRRPGRSGQGGLDRGAPRARRAAGPEPADRLVHVPRTDRRRQDRADQGARRISVRRRERAAAHRHVGIHGEALGLAPDRLASRLCRL